MKKILLIILALIMLASCQNTEPRQEQEKPQEITDTEKEAESYASSEEAINFVKRTAAVFGGTRLKATDRQQPWVFGQMLLSEMEAAGEKITYGAYTGSLVEKEKYISVIEKYFGENCIAEEYIAFLGEEVEVFQNADVHQWKTESINLKSVNDGKAVYSLTMYNIHCGCKIDTLAEYEITETESGFYLRFVSNSPNLAKYRAAVDYREQAMSLAEQIVGAMKSGAHETGIYSHEGINVENFIFMMPQHTNHGEKCNRNAPFYGVLKRDVSLEYHFPADEVEKIIFWTFGTDMEDFSWGDNFTYDENKNEYISGLEWGMGGTYSCEIISAQTAGEKINVLMELTDNIGFKGEPGWESHGKYTMTFEKTDGFYLRFIGMESMETASPEPEIFNRMYASKSEAFPAVKLTEAEYEKLQKILQKDKWIDFPEDRKLMEEPFSPSNCFVSEENEKAQLYISPDGEYSFIMIKWTSLKQYTKKYLAPKEVAYDIEAFREEVFANAKEDGRYIHLGYDEEPYIFQQGKFDEFEFRSELYLLMSSVGTEFDSTENRLLPAENYLITKTYQRLLNEGTKFSRNDDGQLLIPEEEVIKTARYSLGIRDFSKEAKSKNGYYAMPFSGLYVNPKIISVSSDSSHISANVHFYHIDDNNCEGPVIRKMHYNYLYFSVDGKTEYRPLAAWEYED